MASLAIAAAVAGGSAALQYLLTPRPQRPAPIDKGKFDDIRIQGADYGAFIPRIWGTARIAGNLIFSSGIDHEIENTPSQDGK
jgi:hypothetical protein